MSQAQVTQLSGYVAIGPEADQSVVTQLSLYVLLVPGDDTGDDAASERQGFCYAQKVRRD